MEKADEQGGHETLWPPNIVQVVRMSRARWLGHAIWILDYRWAKQLVLKKHTIKKVTDSK